MKYISCNAATLLYQMNNAFSKGLLKISTNFDNT